MKLVSTSRMRELEAATVAAGSTWASLMEQAGWGVAQEALALLGNPRERMVVVLVGPGNNGGDGLVAARHLHDAGAQLALYLWKRTGAPDDINWQRCRQREMAETLADNDADERHLLSLLERADMVIDALIGMGISRMVDGKLAAIVRRVNRFARQPASANGNRQAMQRPLRPLVLAVDMPTGVHSDSGALMGEALRADVTVATGLPKVGLLLHPGHQWVGRLFVVDIGIPASLLENAMSTTIDAHRARTLLPTRPADAHKGTFGKALVIAGSLLYPGAAGLATAAAARVGAGLVTLATARSIIPTTGRTPEVTLLPLPEAERGTIAADAVDEIDRHLASFRALLLGPGLGTEEATRRFVARLLGLGQQQRHSHVGFISTDDEHTASEQRRRARGQVGFVVVSAEEQRDEPPATTADTPALPPLVLDADGLNILADIDNWWEHLPAAHMVLTPHPGEMKRLLRVEALNDNLVEVATGAATRWRQIVVLKGATTIVAAPDGRSAIYAGGNPALATAGTGDVLAGAIAGLLAQGLAPFEAAVLGVYLHGAAGALVRNDLGDAGAIASDLLPRLPLVIKEVRGQG